MVIKSLNLANPQWTPIGDSEPEWMAVSFDFFKQFDRYCKTFEVFPSASYNKLDSVHDLSVRVSFNNFLPGPKDMLNSIVGALTVKGFVEGRGTSVGGGDQLGEIILPRPIQCNVPQILKWPER